MEHPRDARKKENRRPHRYTIRNRKAWYCLNGGYRQRRKAPTKAEIEEIKEVEDGQKESNL